MASLREAKSLITSQKYKEAGKMLDRLIGKKESDELWYLRGLVSLKMRSYDAAIEAFTQAIMIRKTALYYRMSGIAKMELFELEDAIEDFERSLEIDPGNLLSNFYMAISLMFLDDPESAKYLRRAYRIDSKRTKGLLNSFYIIFFKKDPLVNKAIKESLKQRIDNIRTN